MGRTHRLERTQLIDHPIGEVFTFFSDAANLEALTPTFLKFRILTMPPEMKEGVQIVYQLRLFGVPIKWRTRITAWEEGRRFIDEQESGPYALWRHTHEFEARGDKTEMRDVVEYREPLGPLGTLAHHLFVRRTVEKIFDFRKEALGPLLQQQAAAQQALALQAAAQQAPTQARPSRPEGR